MENFQVDGAGRACCEDKFYMGFKECQDEVMRYYVEFEGRDIKDPVCINIGKHLEQASQKFLPSGECTLVSVYVCMCNLLVRLKVCILKQK